MMWGQACWCNATSSCRFCYAGKLKEALGKARFDLPPTQVDKHDPRTVAMADATRLGHQVNWSDEGTQWLGTCSKCHGGARVLKRRTFGREQVTGTVVTLRCKP